MWERWREGETLHAIAQLFDRHHLRPDYFGEHRRHPTAVAMAVVAATERARPSRARGTRRGVRSAVSWPITVHWPVWWRATYDCSGHRIK